MTEGVAVTPLLTLTGARKRFGATVAVSGAGLRAYAGEVHALIGANGSGKSTLVRIITGVVRPDGGDLTWDGRGVAFQPPLAALHLGITAAYQELSLIPHLTVRENVALSVEALGRPAASLTALLAQAADEVGVTLSPDVRVADLAQDERHVVEILKALATSPRLLILDEATASLDRRQVEGLFRMLRRMTGAGLACVFVTHRFDEVFAIASRITVMRNGATVRELPTAQATLEDLVVDMTGHAPTTIERPATPPRPASAGAPLLDVRTLHARRLHDVNLKLWRGEIVGLGGLRGHGQTDLLHSLCGAQPVDVGEIRFDGKPLRISSPREAARLGIEFVTGDRRKGTLQVRPITENFLLPSWPRYRQVFWLDMPRATAAVREMADRLALVHESLNAPLASLSGGNQQKVLVGRALLSTPRLLLLDDPTVGVDVLTKTDFYQLLDQLRQAELGILLYSSDENELVSLCDRVLVMFEGRILGELSGGQLTRERLVSASMGVIEPAGGVAP